MKITVDIKDFYTDDGDIEKSIKSAIKGQVFEEIWRKIEEKAGWEIKKFVEEKLEKCLQKRIADFMSKANAIPKNGGEPVPLEKWLDEMLKRNLQDHYGIRGLDEKLTRKMSEVAEQLVKRYDMNYAATIVNKLREKKMLNDEAVKLLLS